MARPTYARIDSTALLHNLKCVKQYAPTSKVIAMIKANAYGCGLPAIAPFLDGHVDAFGVACLEEAMMVRSLGLRTDCILFQGIFSANELPFLVSHRLQCVIHQAQQLQWILATPLTSKIRVWVKVNTGMHRLGFAPQEVDAVLSALKNCAWIDEEIGLMTHLACADEPLHPSNQQQLKIYSELCAAQSTVIKSISNSAAIIAFPSAHVDMVRPGLMLYGISPFSNQTGQELGLIPVMRFVSAISALHHYPASVPIGYGGIWHTKRPSLIGVVAAGYGDGYPRHITQDTPVWINGQVAPIVGRVSMDTLTIDLTECSSVKIGDAVELWGQYIPIEKIAAAAGTIAYELMCQFSPRALKTTAEIMDNI